MANSRRRSITTHMSTPNTPMAASSSDKAPNTPKRSALKRHGACCLRYHVAHRRRGIDRLLRIQVPYDRPHRAKRVEWISLGPHHEALRRRFRLRIRKVHVKARTGDLAIPHVPYDPDDPLPSGLSLPGSTGPSIVP